ncbi:DUF4127 family protein [Superficieibacter sp.]|uniref:DUF4127 family protein n=1 Tax=Superficieibacter sp. TaxID=2303322 RepID=UPI0028A637FD|nr:DUF4127 family protein [Superficieibacter sp.]
MIIVGIPLDIRPYNYDFLQSLAAMNSQLNLLLPEKNLLGFKKQPARHGALNDFLRQETGKADALIVSLDMYVYGGLFPARVHNERVEVLLSRLHHLRQIKWQQPDVKIYASALVLRTPCYDSSEEEPDWYATYGKAVYTYGFLSNKQQRVGLDTDESARLEHYQQLIPAAVLQDWLSRREKNRQVIQAAIQLVAEGVLEQLVIPLDDTAEFGFTAADRSRIYQWIDDAGVHERVHVHPGTDESGCTLLTRAWLDQRGRPFPVSVLYSNEQFSSVIPNYEDRPFIDSLRSHTAACGITLAAGDDQLYPLLAINGCGDIMQESAAASYGYDVHTGCRHQPHKNVTYSTRRSLDSFVAELTRRTHSVPVVIADLAFSNGGETELVDLLDHYGACDRICGYAGWNTTCNSLGTALATLVFASGSDNLAAVRNFLQERIMSNWAWQTEVRFPMQCEFLPASGASYADFDAVAEMVFSEIKQRLKTTWKAHLGNSFGGQVPEITHLSAPFHRLSGLNIKTEMRTEA